MSNAKTSFKYSIKDKASGATWGDRFVSTNDRKDDFIEYWFGRHGLPAEYDIEIQQVEPIARSS